VEASTRQKLELRPLQVDTMDLVRAAFREGHRKVVLYGPTGFGKTEMACGFMQATSQKFNRAAMVMDRRVLVDQTSKRLDKYGIDHGVMMSDHWRHRPSERIQVLSAQTIEKRGAYPPDLKLLVVDECHAMRKMIVELLKAEPDLRVIGLSASPFTEGLADVYDTVVSATTTQQLVELGFLAPLKVFVAKRIDMTGAKKTYGEWRDDEVRTRSSKITGDVVTEWERKCTEIFGGPRKTIVFSANIAHGLELMEGFAKAGFNFQAISADDTDEFKRDVIEDFSQPDTALHGIISTDILTKGFDVSDVMVGVSARPFSKSFSSHVQQMGRVMRAHPGKEFALWLDHSGNYIRFQEDWDDVYENGVHELKSDKEVAHKEPTEQEFAAATCPACKAPFPRLSLVCVNCGFKRQKTSRQMEVEAGELVELGVKAKASKDEKQQFYSQLLTVVENRGYNPGWAAHKYKAKFGVYPRGLAETPAPVTQETMKFLQHLRIKHARGEAR
jgi:superfamily II DNA or RNA helicase